MYKDLSLKEKARIIREGVRLGLNSIDDILSLYDEAISYLQGGPIVSPYGQWKYPGRDTIIPSNNITMANVNYPVLGVSDTGDTKVMIPWNDYKFKGSMVYEHPLISNLALEGKKFNRQKDLDIPFIILKVNKSNADFVLRLKDPNRAYIQDWENPNMIATHKLSWADDGIVYPLVLNINGRLIDFSRPPYNIWAGYDSAIKNGDTIHMTPEEAEWFTTHYKNYYPMFDKYSKGGTLYQGGGDAGIYYGNYNNKRFNTQQGINDLREWISAKIMSSLSTNNSNEKEISFPPAFTQNGGTAQASYLLSRKPQRDMFLRHGYIQGKNKDYGLVRNAVGNRNIPVYQTAEDANVKEENLINIGWKYNNDAPIPEDTKLFHAGYYPTATYIDGKTGLIYLKSWDLNNYYNPKYYTGIKRIGSKILDLIGSPVVITTGYLDTGFNALDNNWKSTLITPQLNSYLDSIGMIKDEYGIHLPEVVITPNEYKKGGHLAQIGRKLRLPNRINRNTSLTLELSEDYETEMRLRISGADPQYLIPYIPDKSILINGSTTSTNVLDSIVKYAGIHNRDLKPAQNPAKANPKPRKIEPYEAIGLGILETHLGALPSTNIKRPSNATDDEWKQMLRAWYNANQFTAYGDIPSYALLNNYHWLDTNGSVHPLLDAMRYYSLGDYNTGDKNHTSDVKNAGLKVWKNLNIQDWWNNSGKYVYEGKPTPEQTTIVEFLKADPLNYDRNGVFQYDAFGNPIKALGGNLFKKGGIYINPKNKGKLTETMKRTGKSKYELAHSKNPLTRKRALFAINASHWKHDEGGHLFLEDGQIFKSPLDDLTGRNILTSPILPPKSYYEQFTIPELKSKKPQPLQPLEGTYGNKYSELVPMSDETYVNNSINKGLQLDWRTHALEFAPFLAIGAGPAIGSTATWLATSKPTLYNLGRMTLGSEIGGRSVDLASNLFTGNTWGLNVGNVVEGITGWNPNNTMVGLFVTDLTNPGYSIGLEKNIKLRKEIDPNRLFSYSEAEYIKPEDFPQVNIFKNQKPKLDVENYLQKHKQRIVDKYGEDAYNKIKLYTYNQDEKSIKKAIRDAIWDDTHNLIYALDNNFINLKYRELAKLPAFNIGRQAIVVNPELTKKIYPSVFELYGDDAALGLIKSHELEHAINWYKNMHPSQKATNGLFDLTKLLKDSTKNYFEKHNNTELSARGSLIKDYFDSDIISGNLLRFAARNYVKDTGIDNDMTAFFNGIKDWDGMAKWITKNSSMIATPFLIGNIINKYDKDLKNNQIYY